MAERRNYRYRQSQSRGLPRPFKDLRELLDFKKQQREREEQEEGPQTRGNAPPADPPSILRDRLRGDFPSTSQYRRNDSQQGYSSRGRGSFRKRGGGPRYMQGGSSHYQREKLFAYNIKVELSTETGQRKYTLDNENPMSQSNENNPSGMCNTNQQNTYQSQNKRGYPRNRGNYRGPRRGQGNYREVYYYRGQNRKYSTKNQQTDTSNTALKTDNEKKGIPPINTTAPELYEEENWDNDDVPSTNTNESKCNTNKEDNSENKEFVDRSGEKCIDSSAEYGSQEGQYLEEQEYLEGQEEYTSEDGQYVDGQEYLEGEREEEEYYNDEYGAEGNYYEDNYDNTTEDRSDDKKQLSEDGENTETEPKTQDGVDKQIEKNNKETKKQNIENQATDVPTKNIAATDSQSKNVTNDQEKVTPKDKTGNAPNLSNDNNKKSSEIKKVGNNDNVTNVDTANKDNS